MKAPKPKEYPLDFATHLNYVECLYLISNTNDKLSVECKLNIQGKIKESEALRKKIGLIKLIKKSLDGEWKTIEEDSGFAEVCVPWIAVKAYYLMFNLFLILEYLILGQERSFNLSHCKLLEKLKDRIGKKEIVFSEDSFNTNFRCSRIFHQRVKSGANLKKSDFDLNERIAQVLKKLTCYKLEDFQRSRKIANFRSKKNQQEKREFLNDNTVNLCEFFYWYRIKSNYRDLEFLDQDISDDKFYEFYYYYFKVTDNFYDAIKTLVNNLSKDRLGKEVLC